MKIYIIPTRFGLLASSVGVFLVLTGIIYSSNGTLIVAFFLASLFIAMMFETHSHMKSIRILETRMGNGFVGGTAELKIVFRNSNRSQLENFEVDVDKSHELTRFRLGPEEQLLVSVPVDVIKRGKQVLKRIRVGTTSSSGLFWAWTYLKVNAEYLGYPAPKGRQQFPEPDAGTNGILQAGDEFTGHRRFAAGDSWRRVDWKAVARGRPWLIKSFESGSPNLWAFEYQRVAGSQEDRLSQLSLWVQKANRENKRFSLLIGNRKIEPGQGSQHMYRCLQELALYEEL